MLNPTFPADALEREREVQIADIAAQKDNLLKSASNAMRRALFGNAGYGLDSLGTEESVARLKAADLKSFHQKLAAPDNCVLAIYGDVKTDKVQSRRRKGVCQLETGRDIRCPDRKVRDASDNRPYREFAEACRRKPATKNRPCWSSVFPARRCSMTTVTRWN